MKIFSINSFYPNFKGTRQDRKTVSQLKEDNPYDLNKPNQRRINQAIENLSQIPGEDNARFLFDVSQHLKYGTRINLGKKSYNDWREKLNQALEHSISISEPEVQQKLSGILDRAKASQNLSKEEVEILKQREFLLESINFKQLEKLKSNNIKNLRRNLDYFIISSEVPISQKLYILKRLNHLMSPQYKINPQLADKKSQVVAEIVNDIVVNTPESDIPNSKEINQMRHGMCASISICRKLLSYEDKPNYVDMVMSELDDKDYMEVYDITKLGSHKKIPIPKVYIDYDYALERGYRIVDTSALYWMNVGDTAGAYNDTVGMYTAFDKNFFDTFTDSHLLPDLDDELVDKQDYFRSLVKAKDVFKEYLSDLEKEKIKNVEKRQNRDFALDNSVQINREIRQILRQISPNLSDKEQHNIFNDLLSLGVKNSDSADKIRDYRSDFVYIPNESDEAKIKKIERFLETQLGSNINSSILKSKASEILSLVSELHEISGNSKSIGAKIRDIRGLYNVASAYRTQQIMQLSIPEYQHQMMTRFKLPDKETLLMENLAVLSEKIKENKINPELKRRLAENFNVKGSDQDLADALEDAFDTVQDIVTTLFDTFYNKLVLLDRKHSLATQLLKASNEIDEMNDPQDIRDTANNLGVKPNKEEIKKILEYYVNILESDECSEEEYFEIYNQTGFKSHLFEFKDQFENVGTLMFRENNEKVRQAFNLLNGVEENAPRETSIQLYHKLGEQFNQASQIINTYQQLLHIEDSEGNILNTVDAKYLLLNEFEKMGEVPTKPELTIFRDRFAKIDRLMTSNNGKRVKYRDLPKELLKFSPKEKEILKKYRRNLNFWYSMIVRKLDEAYRDIQEPLDELNRDIGLRIGYHWIPPEGRSGLNERQQIKIIEHMTDRPYYIDEDVMGAIRRIKRMPYSGISSTSVMHTHPASHAQYISDIQEIATNDGQIKEVIFHDNTWGPIEHENTWTDEDGFLRTDYSGGYGGQFGFITNEDYLNGNIAENVINQVGEEKAQPITSKRLKKYTTNKEDYKFPLFSSVMMAGIYPRAMETVREIRQNILISPYEYLDQLEKYANNMTKNQIESAIKKDDDVYNRIQNIYSEVLQKINGDELLKTGIKTQKDYDDLADNDSVKILLEKIAIVKSYSNIPDFKALYKEYNSIDELKTLRANIEKEARNNFDYTFAKHKDITKYITESSRNEIYGLLKDFAKENNIEINDKQLAFFINYSRRINNKDFDGSLEHTIDLMSKNFGVYLQSYLKKRNIQIENEEQIIQDLSQKVKNIFDKNSQITNKDKLNIPNIENWIDRVFNPSTDEEFIKIFNRLRNMTSTEFNKLYNSQISNSDIGIKNITGYDISQLLRSENERTQNLAFNILYQQQYIQNMELSKTTPSYDYNKLSRVLHGAKYVNGVRTFDDIYNDYYYSLMGLTIGERFKKYKHQAFKQYGAFPSYPQVEISTPEAFESTLESIRDGINYHTDFIKGYKAQIKSMELIDKLEKNIKKCKKSGGIMTTKQYETIVNYLVELQKINQEDDTIEDVIKLIQPVLDSGTKSVDDFDKLIKVLSDKISKFSKIVSGETMPEALKEAVEALNTTKLSFINSTFLPKHRARATELFNKMVRAKAIADADEENEKLEKEAEKCFVDFVDFCSKYKILRKPEVMLNEYLKLCAKDSITDESNKKLASIYKDSLKGLLFKANMQELQYILMNCAENGSLGAVSSALKNSQLELKDGSFVDMSSDIGINLMISPLLGEENLATAVFFINQMGLAEKLVETVYKGTEFSEAYKDAKRRHSIFASVDKQVKCIRDEMAKLGDIDNDPDAIEKIKKFGEKIISVTNNTNYRRTKELYQEAIKEILKQISDQPDLSKTAILSANMEYAIKGAIKVAMAHGDLLSQELKRLSRVALLLQKLNIKKGTPEYDMLEDFGEKCNKLIDYQETLATSYPNINLQII